MNGRDMFKFLMESSIIFIDEFDKMFLGSKNDSIGSFYLELQKQLLTLVEGCTVNMDDKVGTFQVDQVNTENITFIGAGTFEDVNDDKLISELKGRFPVKIKISKLTYKEYKAIIEKPDRRITNLRKAFPSDVRIDITDNALCEMAKICDALNKEEYLGARRIDQIEDRLWNYITELVTFKEQKKIKIDRRTVRKLTKGLFRDCGPGGSERQIGFTLN